MASLSSLAYLKVVLHAAKYPANTVIGLLVGTVDAASSTCTVSDAIPLVHAWTDLAPMTEAGLQLAQIYADQHQLVFLGLYVANERLGDQAIPHGAQKIADALRKERPNAFVLVVDNEKLASPEPALIPYTSSKNGTWSPTTLSSVKISLTDASIPQKALSAARQGRYAELGDFDDYLSDAGVDWLRNPQITV
ncbi:hypothetical protein JCM10908_001523 [Rhodotorula pacifica]|uniref:ER membrane protein complex subunit 8/9 family protein n=1 Tax=Rhodotorula pacifica TaxID=1495444 RepID=UPI00317475F0